MGGRSSFSGKQSGLITSSSSNYGVPGTYEVHRSGDLSAPNKMIFLSASFGEASNYGKESNKNIDTYHIKLNNPLVVNGSTDGEMLRNAWEKLHPGKSYPKGPMTSKKWQTRDKENASALSKSSYDAIIYKKPSGRHEVQITKKDANKLVKTKTTKHSGKRYTYDNRWI
jgi:hypothetical protein